MSIFQILSNVKHNGDNLTAGNFFEGELAEFAHLVKDGVLRIMEGAKNLEHAAEIAQKESEVAQQAAAEAEQTQPQNTWESKKPEATPSADETADKPLAPGQVGQGDQPPAPAADAGANL